MRYEYFATVTRVVDGDTLDLDVDLGLKVHAYIRVRLQGVDTPEIFGVEKESDEYAEGIRAKRFVEHWLEVHGKNVIAKTEKDKRGKYGRWVAVIWSGDEERKSLNDELSREGWADI